MINLFPILFDLNDQKYIPLSLRGYVFYPVDTEKGFEALYRRLTDQPLVVRPKPGPIKKLPSRQSHANQGDTATTPEMPLGCVYNLPLFNQTHHFGRKEFLTQLHDIFTSGNTAILTQTITGLGGVGKTEITLAYANTYQENYQYLWWVRAENPTTCDLDYQAFARRMDLCGPEADRLEIITKVREWQEQNKGWLFIYDNAMEYTSLQDYLPRFPKGHILLTTRNQHYQIGNLLPVDVFTPEIAAEFLCFRIKRSEPDSSLALGRELGGLPLALEQAAAYIENNHLTLQAYLDLFRKHKLRLFKSQPPANYHFNVATTWQISLEKITREATRQLLYFTAFLAPDGISKQLFSDGAAVLPQPLSEAVIDEVIFNEMLTELNTYSLIRRNEDGCWSIHRLLQEVVRESLNQEQVGWANSVIKLLDQVYDFDYNQQKTWEKSRQLIPHMQAAVEIAVSLQIENKQLGQICNEIGYYLHHQGRYEEAKPLYNRALEIRERVLGPDHPETATSLNNLAALYYNQGWYEEAEPLYKRALEIVKWVLGPDHPDMATSLNNLASLYNNQGRYEEAEPLYKRALEIVERVLGPEHPDTATSLNNLAIIYNNQGRYEEAEPLYKRALEISERVLGPDHPDTAISLNNLALLYNNQDRYEEAEPLCKRALEIVERVLGLDHPDTATTLNNLAIIL